MGAPNGINAPTSRTRAANTTALAASADAKKELERLRQAGDALVTADFIKNNFDSLAYQDTGGYAYKKTNEAATNVRRGDNGRRKAEKALRREERELRISFNNPESRSNDRAELFRKASQGATLVSSLMEKAAQKRRRARNDGTSLSAADALGL